MPTSTRLTPVVVLVFALIMSLAGCDGSPPTPDRPTPSASRHATRGDLIETLDDALDDAAAGPSATCRRSSSRSTGAPSTSATR